MGLFAAALFGIVMWAVAALSPTVGRKGKEE